MSLTISLDDVLSNDPASLRLPRMSYSEFWSFCQQNPDLQVELGAEGNLIFRSPTGATTGNRNMKLGRFLDEWSDRDGTGITFDSSTLFRLPNGAVLSPDAAWVRLDRWNALTAQQQDEPAPLAPDFVVELMSPSDRFTAANQKMQEYAANGVRLGMLIDRKKREVRLYRPSQSVTVLHGPITVSGDPELPGFLLDMQRIF